MDKISNKHCITISCECETRFTGEDEGQCGICVEVCPEVFEIANNRVRIKNDIDINKVIEKVMIAIKNCPVEAIILT